AVREVHRARHPDLREWRRARSARADGVPGRRPHRRRVLVLPRAEVRYAARVRTVDRARSEAAVEVAEPLLLDQCVRAEVLPEGHHQLREHARHRQGHVRRLLPDGAHPRSHLRRAPRRSVPRSRVAEVPARERAPAVRARPMTASEAYTAAQAGGVVDTAVGFPQSREDIYAYYEFIRKASLDTATREGTI